MDKILRKDFDRSTFIYLAGLPAARPRYRLLTLSPAETVTGEICDDIIAGSGSYSEKRTNGARKTLSLSVYDRERKYARRELSSSFWWGRRFRFDVGISYKGDTYWAPKGVVTPTSVSGEGEDVISLNLSDKFAFLDGTVSGVLEMTYKIQRDQNIYNTIKSTLALDSGTGYPLDPKPIIIDKDLRQMYTYYTQTLEAGGSYGDFMEALREMCNADMYYNDNGNLCFVNGLTDLARVYDPVAYGLVSGDGKCLGISRSKDWSSAYNQVRVVGAQIDGDLLTCSITNTNPYSRLRVGPNPVKCKTVTDNNIVSQKYVCDRAMYEMENILLLQENYAITASLVPDLRVDTCVALTDEKLGLRNEKLLISGISIPISAEPQMQISAVNTKNLALFKDWSYNASLEQVG